MAKRRKQEDSGGGGGAPAWMATFSDLMNLLLCFFVLLFSMSSINEEKFEEVASSFRQSFGIFEGGSSSILDGSLISSGVSQLSELSDYLNQMESNPQISNQDLETLEEYEKQQEEIQKGASEEIAENIENQLEYIGESDRVDIEVNTQYVVLTLNGALLFDSGSAKIKDSAYEFVDKIGNILKEYDDNEIMITGHTDSIPMTGSSKYEDNMALSSGRAHSVYNFLKDKKGMDEKTMRCLGRAEVEPIASNETEEGRALNRRVEIIIFNEYYNR